MTRDETRGEERLLRRNKQKKHTRQVTDPFFVVITLVVEHVTLVPSSAGPPASQGDPHHTQAHLRHGGKQYRVATILRFLLGGVCEHNKLPEGLSTVR